MFDYNQYYDDEVALDYFPEDDIKPTHHDCPADAIFAIMEHLYDSYNEINAEAIKGHFAYLCEALHISKALLREELCVMHYKDSLPFREWRKIGS